MVVIALVVVVAIAFYASSITGNGIRDLFSRGKSLSPKQNSGLIDKVSLDKLVVSQSVDNFFVAARFKGSGVSLSDLDLPGSSRDSKMSDRFSVFSLLTLSKQGDSKDDSIIKKFTVKGGSNE